MANYQSFHCTTTGYSHIAKGTVCEDFSASYSEEGLHIAVVSDGHGDPACFRSHIGSRLAVEITMENLRSFAGNIRQQGWENRLLNQPEQEQLLRQLIRSIMGNWTLGVMAQLEAEPITQEEYANSRNYEPLYRQGKELTHIFGCTLIAALITDTYMIVLHQGDGRCVVINADGNAGQPVPWDDRCVGNICTSLCHADAVESCRYYVADLKKTPIAGCFVTTDGIEDSLENLDALNAYFCNISSRFVAEGKTQLLENLNRELPRMSQLGSADDTSMAGILLPERIALLSERLALIHQLQVCGTEERKARSKLNSMQRKMEYLKNELAQAQGQYDTLRAEHGKTNQLLDRIRQELQQLLQRQNDTDTQLESASQKLQHAQTEFDEYRAVHESYLQMEQQAQAQAARIRQHLDTMEIPAMTPPEETAPQLPDWEAAEPILWDPETAAAGTRTETPAVEESAAPEAPAEEVGTETLPIEEAPAWEEPEAAAEEIPAALPAEASLPEQEEAVADADHTAVGEDIPDETDDRAFLTKLVDRILGRSSKRKQD